MQGARTTQQSPRLRIAAGELPRIYAGPYFWVLAISLASSGAFAASSLLVHYSFRSFGWDLGLFDQVLWNTAHGRPFEYSFRDISYLGDHFSPALLLLSPLALLNAGPAPLLVVQGIAFGLACIPLYAATRRIAGESAAWLLTLAYVLGLAQARAVNYDFHPECFVPALAFTSLWALTARRTALFSAAVLLLLLLKEDAALMALALAWVAWFEFGLRKAAVVTAGAAVAYTALVLLLIIPHFLGYYTNPLSERYGYLGDGPAEMAFNAITRPGLLLDQLARLSALEASALVFLGAGLLPFAAPRLLPPLAVLIIVPLLAQHPTQGTLSQHYMVVPSTFALVATACALRRFTPSTRTVRLLGHRPHLPAAAAGVALLFALAVFAWKSPLPPSFAADLGEFHVDSHARLARTFVEDVPDSARVSAQATYVPHLSQRRHIYEFPRVKDAEWVLVDEKRAVPSYDGPNYDHCLQALPSMGFELVRAEDGISLWRRSGTTVLDPLCK